MVFSFHVRIDITPSKSSSTDRQIYVVGGKELNVYLIDSEITENTVADMIVPKTTDMEINSTLANVTADNLSGFLSPQILDAARLIPKNILKGNAPRSIDEWQLAPELWNTVRNEIDARRKKGQFILTGSSSPTDDITHHSGAGRFGRVKMRPLSLSESGKSTNQVPFANLFEKNAKVEGNGGTS
ncbi:MAG: AAA family ATPase [Endomicrobium sp.]|nr:AAA family ATPase [Endomicrobium sp.]